MATGDQADMLARIKAQLPKRWFQGETPVLDGFLSGPAWALAHAYSLQAYARLQIRLATATDGWLELWSADFFGSRLPRRPGQTDASYRDRIADRLFREVGTFEGLREAIVDMTGREPLISTRRHPVSPIFYDGPGGYDVDLNYGIGNPYHAYVVVFRPLPASEQDGTADANILDIIRQVKPAGSKVGVQFRD